MAKTFLPLAKSPITTPDLWSKVARNWLGTGVIKAYLNELQVYADSTGMQVKVKSGAANVQAIYFDSDAEEVLAIAAANASNPRIDRIIVRLDLPADTIDFAVIQGAPAVSPTAPTLTQNNTRWEISLAQVYVGANVSTIATGNVTDERVFTGPLNTSAYYYYKGGLQTNITTANTLIQLPIGGTLIKGFHLSGNSLICDTPGVYSVHFIADISGLDNQQTSDVTVRTTKAIGGAQTFDAHFIFGWTGLGTGSFGSDGVGAVPNYHSFLIQLAMGDKLDFFIRCSQSPRNTNGYWIKVEKIG